MLQLRKQHHVHVFNEETQRREPLQACRRKDDPTSCKSNFPRTSWLIDRAVVLCRGLIQKLGMTLTGRQSMLGAMHGPMNEASQNGTHPAMLAVHRFNSDVQLPYRFPITKGPTTARSSATRELTMTRSAKQRRRRRMRKLATLAMTATSDNQWRSMK